MSKRENDAFLRNRRPLNQNLLKTKWPQEKKPRCVNCDYWEINNQFHSSYDGKTRAWCPILGNSIEGWERGCSDHKFKGVD